LNHQYLADQWEDPSEKAPKKKRVSTKTILPTDFVVTEKHRLFARKHGFRSPDLLVEAFRDHHAARGTTFADWDAAFRTWIRNDTERFGNGRKSQPTEEPKEGLIGVKPEDIRIMRELRKARA
jgi:hypothetical protein